MLLQHRAYWSHHGGTWGLPGGARDSHESPAQTALREAAEETGVRPRDVAVRAQQVTSPVSNGWSYTTVVADAAEQLTTQRNGESAELRWVPEQQVSELPLHPGFAASWSALRARLVLLFLDPRLGAAQELAGPRTVPLPDGGFGWARGPEPVLSPGTLPQNQVCVVATAEPELLAELPPGVLTVDVSLLLDRLQ